jgi:hypothetical protein
MIQRYLLILGLMLPNACTKEALDKQQVSTDVSPAPDMGSNSAKLSAREGSITLHIGAVRGETTRVLNARGVVRAQSPALRRCYQEAVARDMAMRGLLELTIVVRASGEIDSISSTQDGNLDDELANCVKQRLGVVRFDPPTEGRAAIVVPMLFGLPH